MSKIEWTEKTWNPVIGCTKVSEGCRNCYAEKMAFRLARMAESGKASGRTLKYANTVKHDAMGSPLPQWSGRIELMNEALGDPLRWVKPRMIFVNSMSDLFHEDVPFDFIDKVFAVMALCPQHTFQILTKRPERMAEYLSENNLSNVNVCNAMRINWPDYTVRHHPHRCLHVRTKQLWPLPNVWLGTSVENQATADKRIPHLLKCPAAVRFVSYEPALAAVDFDPVGCVFCESADEMVLARDEHGSVYWCQEHEHECGSYRGWLEPDAIDWIIVGGESGPGARPCNVDHLLDVMYQCKQAGVACFIKQLGSKPVTSNANLYDIPDHVKFAEYGDAAASASIILKSPKGSDMSEWPEDLRVRQMPVDGGVS